jgi:tetratricopeptide (TPR) repeat protein
MPAGSWTAPLAAALALAAGAVSLRASPSGYPPPSEIRVPAQGAAGDMFALAFGARRLFADAWFVRLMQYYGSREIGPSREEAAGDNHGPAHGGPVHVHGPHCDHGGDFGTGNYPRFLPMALHVLELDPYFTSAALYGAASLAFNMERPAEAREVLSYALKYSPKQWQYLSMLAAIGYSKETDPASVAAQIAPILKEPDCPVMLKQLAAFLNKRAGNYRAAAEIYLDIAATSRDGFYVENARRELEKLAARPRK